MRVKVFNGGVRVEGKCFKAVPAGETGISSTNPLIEYNNNIVNVHGKFAYDIDNGTCIGKLVEVAPKHFQYYIDDNNKTTRRAPKTEVVGQPALTTFIDH